MRADATGIQGLKQRCAIQHKTRILAGFPLHIRVRMFSKQARVDGRESANLFEQRAQFVCDAGHLPLKSSSKPLFLQKIVRLSK